MDIENQTVTFEEILNRDGVLVYTNVGISMMPLIRQNRDILVIKKQLPPFKKYDAVLFKRDNGQYILHRILKINNDKYFIIGDNCLKGEYVNENNIIGILSSLKRNNTTINVTDFKYKLFVHLWWYIYPIRWLLKKSKQLIRKTLITFLK